MRPVLYIALASLLITGSGRAGDEETTVTPHLVVCQNGERTAKVDLGRGELTYVTADIEGLLNLSVRGDFKAVKVLQASVSAPDGKTYSLRTQGEQPPSHPGTFVGFFGIEHEGVINEFSIGHWKVRMSIDLDGQILSYEPDFLVTWRVIGGMWGEQHWANDDSTAPPQKNVRRAPAYEGDFNQAEQGGAGQPATRPEPKSEGGDKPQPEAEGRSR
jgi:hypothetical protein